MTTSFTHPLSVGESPLSAREFEDAEVLVQRLRGELLTALDKLPESSRSALELARDLKLNRNICQRVAAGLNPKLSPIEALLKLPGPDGLTLLVQALIAKGGRAAKQSPLIAAIEAYEQFVRRVGGSQARLRRRIQISHRPVSTPGMIEDNIATRRRLFDAAVDLLGYSVDVVTCITAVRPRPEDPKLMDVVNVYGLIGVRSLSRPVTLVTHNRVQADETPDMPGQRTMTGLSGSDRSGLNLLEEFCSSPLPATLVDMSDTGSRVITEPSESNLSPREAHHAPAVDLVMGWKIGPDANLIYQSDAQFDHSAVIRRPALRLISDVYLHRSLAQACMPTAMAVQAHPHMSDNPLKNWDDRLPGKLTMELLGPGIDNAASHGYPRQQQLTTRTFDLAGWNGDDFVGYRCDVPYPTWSSVYYMLFNFGTRPENA